MTKTKTLIIRNIPEELHEAIKIASIREHKSLQKLVAEILADYLDRRAKMTMAEKLLKREEENHDSIGNHKR